jgi:transposase
MSNLARVPAALLPPTDAPCLETVALEPDDITVTLVGVRPAVPCPLCGVLSRRIHGRYARTLTDLPWGQHRVRLHLTVRKFRCLNAPCRRRIFTERLPEVVAPYARRTNRLTEVLCRLALALGGEGGARLVRRLGFRAGATTLLQLIRRRPLPGRPTPRVLGVDDWALRKGHTYGTILVDLERHVIVDLLPDRLAPTLAQWLTAHPGAEVVARDRAPAYAEGIRQGAPAAQHVADRWHLLHNLFEVLEVLLLQHRPALRAAATPAEPTSGGEGTESAPLDESAPGPLTPHRPRRAPQRQTELRQRRHARRVEQYETIRRLTAAGADANDIARRLGVHRRTVYRYRALPTPPAPPRQQRRPRRRVLTPHEPYLLERWQAGCRNGMRLYRELRAQGYPHGASTVMRFVAQLRREEAAGQPVGTRARAEAIPVPTARHVAALFLRRPEGLTAEEQAYLARLQAADATVATVYQLTQTFTTMVRQRGGAQLDAWLGAVERSDVPALQRFAKGLRADDAAVRAGLTEEWSNGPTEGHVNKLKLVKRQMYGRANFDLLRQRVLHAA